MSRLLDLGDHQANKMTNGSFDHQSYMEVDAPRDETPGYGLSVCAAETGPEATETGPEAEAPPTGDSDRRPCHICSRSFYPDVLSNHVRICRKITSRTRTVFDSRAMRAVGTPIADFTPSAPPPPEGPKTPSNWRRNHERLIANIRAKKDNSQPPPSHAFNYSDNNKNNNNRGYGGSRYAGNAYGDVHHQANNARTPQEAIQLAHNT